MIDLESGKKGNSALLTLNLAVKSIGIIYGDIGTSPLILFTGIFTDPPTDSRDVYGALSLIVWSLTIVVMIKYIFIVLRADDNGEGGTFALYSLLCRHSGISVRGNENSIDDSTITKNEGRDPQEGPNIIKRNIVVQNLLFGLVLFGSSLVMSDGLLTPPISVISAVEGIAVPAPSLAPAIVPLSCVILIVLFLSQQFGTGKVGNLFSPIISLWFIAITSIGIWNISMFPEIFKAYNPYYAVNYFVRRQDAAFTDLGGVFLAVTGVEALFADLGHFTRGAIQISFPFFVYIPLILVHTGQAARLVLDPTLVANTFWLTTPSEPAVASVMAITTILITIVIYIVWRLPIIISIIFFCIFFTIDASFLGATLRKIASGGWFTMSIAIFLTIMMGIWRWGTVRMIHHERLQTPDLNKIFKEKNIGPTDYSVMENSSHEIILENGNEIILGNGDENLFIDTETHLMRSPGIGLFYSDIGTKIPLSFTQFVKHFPIMPQNVVFINIKTVADSKVGDDNRLEVKKIKNYEGCYQVTARYGYSEQVSQGKEFLLQLIESIRNIDPTNKNLTHDINLDSGLVTYIVGQQSLCSKPDSPWWIKILVGIYMFIYFNSRKFYGNWGLPVENTVVVGVNIPI
ncbi:27574_t:CDS:10 [Dentiscutata erythropus]|uniref:27574_t:CDS:1 n=1 Tax=Dentiscutata erythropus TaxID=1348616 RepID=A0A9N8YPC0_9GLOM|nr:27574_t:CDS:10 [Dentiscutata erythropus]